TMRGFLKIIPILLGIISGYIIAWMFGLLDLSAVESAGWISTPDFYTIKFDWSSMLIILPAALVLVPEHIGHLFVTSKNVGKDLMKEPGLDRSFIDQQSTSLNSSHVSITYAVFR